MEFRGPQVQILSPRLPRYRGGRLVRFGRRMTIRSSSVPRITGLVTGVIGGAVLLFIVVGAILKGKPLLAGIPTFLLIVLAGGAAVRGWRRTTLTVDDDTVTVKRAGKTTEVPRRTVRALVQPKPDAGPVELIDEREQTLIKVVEPFRQEDLEKLAKFLGVEIR
jgi:hypothetical protein